jgi:hypothetical protein
MCCLSDLSISRLQLARGMWAWACVLSIATLDATARLSAKAPCHAIAHTFFGHRSLWRRRRLQHSHVLGTYADHVRAASPARAMHALPQVAPTVLRHLSRSTMRRNICNNAPYRHPSPCIQRVHCFLETSAVDLTRPSTMLSSRQTPASHIFRTAASYPFPGQTQSSSYKA